MARNSLSTKQEPISAFMRRPSVQEMIQGVVGQDKAERFVTSLVSAVTTNPQLQKCDRSSLISSALLGVSLNLSPSPQLGHFYMVPFEDRKNGRVVATFILGYRGYIQLALRSGIYKKINVIAVKEGELKSWNPLTEEAELSIITDDSVRENLPSVGYLGYLEELGGFRKTVYWSREKMEAHALKYSKGYASDKRNGKSYTFWSKDFDSMAFKTILRYMIGRWAVTSIDQQDSVLQTALDRDTTYANEDGSYTYFDNTDDTVEPVRDVTYTSDEDLPEEALDERPDGYQDEGYDDLEAAFFGAQ